MKKETQKEKITRLESEVQQYIQLIYKMQSNADSDFSNSPHRKQLERRLFVAEETVNVLKQRIESLEKRSKAKDKYIQELKNENEILKSNSITPVKNARGAGRKTKLDDKKDEIKQLRAEGMKIQELASKYDCSVGKIHKLINE